MPLLRILHVSPYSEYAWAYGGIPRVLSAQIQALLAAGHHVTLATTDVCDSAARLSPAARGAVASSASDAVNPETSLELKVFPNVSNTLAYRWQLFLPLGLGSFLRSHARDFDVAHLHACHNLLTSLAARHLSRAGVPYVLQPNGTAPRIERRLAAKTFFDILAARNLFPRAAAVIAVTDCERRQLEHLDVPPSRVRHVPNPVAPPPTDELPSRGTFRRQHHVGDGPLVMFLGALSPRKQPEVLARAISEMPRSDVQLVVAGNDMGFERFTRRVVDNVGLTARTRFTGLLTGTDRFAALADADIVVYPSRDEVFGLVPLEALQVGTPVIVCDDCGCGEIVREIGGGLVVPPGDSRRLALALDEMLSDLANWRAAARLAAIEIARRFHPDVVCGQLERVYCDAIGSSEKR
jgi:glycosyltransferase involved in cell wall biosynthesis